ncbi:hypothetical protein [Hanstruepera ponticola]|uniref:hypothetical protein n=1 Tax=Hanstruepera ponticola TaxID=2042995 RepID=UPI0013C4D7D5|nr:hypothetical protein [Hanstruepera ponticola]
MLTDKQSIILCTVITVLFVLSGIFGILENFAIIGLLIVGLLVVIVNIVMVLTKGNED